MDNNKKYAPWVRMITEDTALGGGAKEELTAVLEVAAADAENQAVEQASDPELGDSEEDTDPDGRGGNALFWLILRVSVISVSRCRLSVMSCRSSLMRLTAPR